MKIKVIPEDFIVEEHIVDIALKEHGPYRLYVLKKKRSNTLDALKRAAREYQVPFSAFSYGGRKDKHALTLQYITVRSGVGFPQKVSMADSTFSCIGCIDRPMGPDLIEENSFTITVRDLSPGEAVHARAIAETIPGVGYPNYFDDQRFGSYDPSQGFIAEKILRKHYNGALKIYCTRIASTDRSHEKKRKRVLFARWGDWQGCLEHAAEGFEKEAFSFLRKHPKSFVEVLQRVPAEEMSLFFSAYQGYLWNLIARAMIEKESGKECLRYPGSAGEYIFYRLLPEPVYNYLRKQQIPLPASKVSFGSTTVKNAYEKAMKERSLTSSSFNLKKIRQAYFKSVDRPLIMVPDALKAVVADDDRYPGKKKLQLMFTLPRGSYGTMLIKRIFADIKKDQ